MIRASLFACAIAAAIGCRSDRQDQSVQSVEYGRGIAGAVEPAGVPNGPQPPTAPSTGLGYAGDQEGEGSRASAPPAEVDDEHSDTQTDEAGHSRSAVDESAGEGEHELEPSGTVNQNTGAHVHARRVPPRWRRPVPPPPPAPARPPGPTSETASGNGTPTNTGINTENAGTGL